MHNGEVKWPSRRIFCPSSVSNLKLGSSALPLQCRALPSCSLGSTVWLKLGFGAASVQGAIFRVWGEGGGGGVGTKHSRLCWQLLGSVGH